MPRFWKKLSLVALGIIVFGWLYYCAYSLACERELATIAAEVETITLYDTDARSKLANGSSIPSATFPVRLFKDAAASAVHENGSPFWKGRRLAILKLKGGSERTAYFSYYGGFFSIDNIEGAFVVAGRGDSEFDRAFRLIVADQFIPKRHERNAAKGVP